MGNPASATRADAFPAGLRVLVVDDDPTWLKILEKMLRKCSYEVTTCGLARTALDMLRERKGRFDIVISDVNMPDMDGFKLLEQVGLQMDLPVIMMSVDGETSRVMKGVQHGACDYLLKPVRMKELKNIWQHVFRKKMYEMKEIESYDSNELNHMRNRLESFDEWQIHSGGDISSAKKRKDVEKEHNEQDFNDTTSVKKARVVWSVDLHQKFVNAVNQIGFDKVGPKKILDLMNVPGLTRENVASHLQKYRLYLSRLQKQNEGKSLSEIAKSGIGSKDSPGSFGVQSSTAAQTSNSPNTFDLPPRKTSSQDMTPRICEEELRNILPFQVTDTRKVINTEPGKFQKLNYVSEFGAVTSSEDSLASLDYNYNEIYIPKNRQSEVNGNTVMHLMKQDQESITCMKAYSQLQQPSEDQTNSGDHQLQAAPSIHMLTSTTGNDKDSPGNFGVQSSTTAQTSNSPKTFDLPPRKTYNQDMTPRICEEELRNIPPFQVTDARKVINTEPGKCQKLNYVSEFGAVTSSEDSLASLDYNYNEIHIPKSRQSEVKIKHSGDHQLHAAPPIHMLTSTTGNYCSPSHVKPDCTFETNHARNVPSAHSIDLLSSQVDSKVPSAHHFEAASRVKGCRTIESDSYSDSNSICSWNSPPQLLNPKTDLYLNPLHDLFVCSVPRYGGFDNFGINSLEASAYKDNQTPPATDFQESLYDEVQYNCEYLFDLPEPPTVDYGLFT
ncbi:hypothetical protein Taro_006515 [Colocasia esculenta]|uniref:Two-component response regulator n=1 Tax=Colocasia esculenta TaxID=4460 RepID=A0A843TWA5_COLES|nr:hypothetical protein [Colocasia esculenta]